MSTSRTQEVPIAESSFFQSTVLENIHSANSPQQHGRPLAIDPFNGQYSQKRKRKREEATCTGAFYGANFKNILTRAICTVSIYAGAVDHTVIGPTFWVRILTCSYNYTRYMLYIYIYRHVLTLVPVCVSQNTTFTFVAQF